MQSGGRNRWRDEECNEDVTCYKLELEEENFFIKVEVGIRERGVTGVQT